MDSFAEIAFWLLVALIPILIIMFVKGKTKLAKVIFCFFIAVIICIGAFVSETYVILIFSAIAIAFGILYLIHDD